MITIAWPLNLCGGSNVPCVSAETIPAKDHEGFVMARTGPPYVIRPKIAAARRIGLVAAAVLLGGAAGLAAGQTPIPGEPAGLSVADFSERFVFRAVAADCVAGGWPYLATECLRMPDGSRAPPVRIIAIDRRTPIAERARR
jgi:hypothetical protein